MNSYILSFSFIHVLNFCMQYGKDYEYEAPVKLLDKLLHSLPQSPDEQLVVVSQVQLSLSLSSLFLIYNNRSTILLLIFCLTLFGS